jgi:HD-like signal output (HDOD) protein
MDFIKDVLSGRIALPMVPRVVQRVLTELRRDDASLAKIAGEIEQDPVLNSRVLRLANSSYFAGRRTVAAVDDAISAIGFKPLETLVIACGAQAAFADTPAVNLRQFWLTAAASAACSRQLAQQLALDRDAAYAAGLMQGVGHLILCQCLPQVALSEFGSLRPLWGQELAAKEVAAFGAEHTQISSLWVDGLGMPVAVSQAIAHSLAAPGADVPALARVVQLAGVVAHSMINGLGLKATQAALNPDLVVAAKLDGYVLDGAFAEDFDALKALPAWG